MKKKKTKQETRKTNTQNWLTPAQMSACTGVSIDTLRYYEKEGLVQPIARAANGHRRYSKADVLWIEVLRCLRDTGMTIEQLRHYCLLGEQGETTEPERLALLQAHRQKVLDSIAKQQEAIKLIDHKMTYYTRTSHSVPPNATKK
ncbi:MerR family transcriptional regulator [Marinomonas agarivorans]|nr:MerR family transcriptional regulator [Marinomonas agarivorans]